MDDSPHEPDLDDLHPDAPDTFALRRRVLLTALVTLALYVVALVVIDALRAPPFAALIVAVLIYLFAVRPMMKPVRDAVKLRRRLAFQAWADARDAGTLDDGTPRG